MNLIVNVLTLTLVIALNAAFASGAENDENALKQLQEAVNRSGLKGVGLNPKWRAEITYHGNEIGAGDEDPCVKQTVDILARMEFKSKDVCRDVLMDALFQLDKKWLAQSKPLYTFKCVGR